MTLHSTATRTVLALALVAGVATLLLGAAPEVAVLASLAVAMVGAIAVRTREDWAATDPHLADERPATEAPATEGPAAERPATPQTTR